MPNVMNKKIAAKYRKSDGFDVSLSEDKIMKTIVGAIAAVAVVGAAPAAFAQDDVQIEGQAEALCTLPTAWTYVTGTGGAGSSQFDGTTWSITPSHFADAEGDAVVSGELAIRIRGDGFCNTSHTIQLTSLRGGLAAGAIADPGPGVAPAGFANRRNLRYEAYWSAYPLGNSNNGAFGAQASLNASSPGQTTSAAYVVSGTRAPPGNRAFDIRIGMPRGALSAPLVGGVYSDQVTVTLSPSS